MQEPVVIGNKLIVKDKEYYFSPRESANSLKEELCYGSLSELYPSFNDKITLLYQITDKNCLEHNIEYAYRNYPKKHKELHVYSSWKFIDKGIVPIIYYEDFRYLESTTHDQIIHTTLITTLRDAQSWYTHIYLNEKEMYPDGSKWTNKDIRYAHDLSRLATGWLYEEINNSNSI